MFNLQVHVGKNLMYTIGTLLYTSNRSSNTQPTTIAVTAAVFFIVLILVIAGIILVLIYWVRKQKVKKLRYEEIYHVFDRGNHFKLCLQF